MDRTTLTAALKTLERQGLVVVAPDHRDRRSRLLSLTDEGRAALAAAVPIWEQRHADVESLLNIEEVVNAAGLRKGLMALF